LISKYFVSHTVKRQNKYDNSTITFLFGFHCGVMWSPWLVYRVEWYSATGGTCAL